MTTNNDQSTLITVTGNVGTNPERLTSKARTKTSTQLDRITGELKEVEYQTKEQDFHKFQLGVNATAEDKAAAGLPEDQEVDTIWLTCLDWKNEWTLLRAGDFIQATGQYRERIWIDKDEQRRITKELHLESVKVLRRKIRQQVA